MMFNIVPLISILISLGVIIVIVLRKFSVLANLDVDSIPAEREARVKERIIGSRLKRSYFKYYSRASRAIAPALSWLAGLAREFYAKLVEARDSQRAPDAVMPGLGVVEKLLLDAGDLAKEGRLDEAEKKFIEIIGIDSVNIQAFKELGKLYYERKDYNEAKQTLLHALKLKEKELDIGRRHKEDDAESEISKNKAAELYFDLTLANRALEQPAEALASINNALKLAKNNPRYLDTKIEISIMNKDKASALDAWEKLGEVNPENQKLAGLKSQISEL